MKNKRLKVRTIFWDVGKVLFSEAQISRKEFLAVRRFLGISSKKSDQIFDRLWPQGLRVGRTSEDFYWKQIIDVSKNKPDIEEVKKLYRRCIQTNEFLLDLAKKLSKNYEQYIVTNHAKEWMDYLWKTKRLERWFKYNFCSGDLGIYKPQKKFFRIALDRSKANPPEVLYIDDNKDNIESAFFLGIETILYKNEKNLVSKLKEAGVLSK